ncbi:MAG: hypothetical protein A2X84_03405 [Desulfuromonadaceae bacterium GWC2_58_13]|nr:MAG: hypothetical protein A2X84_03405 [Desulfuromonadaceae bacterium GWC2_58_13]
MNKQVFLNKILTETLQKLEEEVGGLLGQEFTCPSPGHSLTSRSDLIASLNGKAVLATFNVTGDKTGTAYVIVGLKDAITLGGTLILLPPDEMESRRKKDLFDGEVIDAYGEIANIMAGVYTAVFNEYANPKLHFKKIDLAPFAPANPNSPIPDGNYYVTTCSTQMAGKPLGTLNVLIPPDLLGIEPPEEKAQPATEPTQSASTTDRTGASGQPTPAADSDKVPEPQRSTSPESTVILVVSETQQAAEAFAQNFIDRCNCKVTCMHFQGDFQTTAKGKNVKGVFLAMREVGERGLASIIKIQSAVGEKTPLVAAGPEWTRKTVLQAVKYGASDILVTPATPEELLAKINQHMQIPPN